MSQSKEVFNINNKVIVITGATGVLGEAFVKAVAGLDAKVVLIGRNEKIGKERANEINELGKEAFFIKADVLSKDDLLKAKEIVLEKWGRIDGLVNAAGGNVPEAMIQPGSDIFEIDIDGLKKAFDLNLFGTILPVSVFGKSLQESGNAAL